MNIREHDIDGEPPSADVQAGEYVLGVLDRRERRLAEVRAETEPAFARLVADWERRLGELIAEIDPVAVPAHLWPRLRTRLGWSPVQGAAPRGLWNHLGFWRGATALAATLAVAAFLFGRAPEPAPVAPPVVQQPPVQPQPTQVDHQPTYPVTQLARDDGSTGWLASVDQNHGKVMMMPVPAPQDTQGRVAELWLIPKGEAPRSLGLISTEWADSVGIPADALGKLAAGATLAITLEPPGGAPHGAPTGPIIAKGGISL
ncbi:anti-sigma factor [Pseudomonas sp. CGJS7]|uniref:anti-sigma factor n=1 Tax=Pseudomonas sp. CGJS7 TaxID=3109348 RepID=UPI00300940B5